MAHELARRARLRPPQGTPRERRHRLPPRRGPRYLALLRRPRRARVELAAARQLTGRASGRSRPADLPYQYRTLAERRPGSPGFRLSQHRRICAALYADLRFNCPPRTLRGASAQLVRHPPDDSTRAPLCVNRRQRQSDRQSMGDGSRVAGIDRDPPPTEFSRRLVRRSGSPCQTHRQRSVFGCRGEWPTNSGRRRPSRTRNHQPSTPLCLLRHPTPPGREVACRQRRKSLLGR